MILSSLVNRDIARASPPLPPPASHRSNGLTCEQLEIPRDAFIRVKIIDLSDRSLLDRPSAADNDREFSHTNGTSAISRVVFHRESIFFLYFLRRFRFLPAVAFTSDILRARYLEARRRPLANGHLGFNKGNGVRHFRFLRGLAQSASDSKHARLRRN